jgi:arabinogalactan oligomer/maltooligosaccharide transport system substrate-binding protein
MFSKKKVTGIALAVAVGFSSVVSAVPAMAVDEAKVLTIWADESRGPNLTRALGAVEAQKLGEWVSGYKVAVKTFSSFDALKTAVDNATAISGPDIIVGANDWVATGAANGKLAPITLTASVKKNFNPNSFLDLSYKGKLYGVPVDVNNVAMIYNTKLVKSAPKTFGEMVDLYKANKTSKGLKSGLCIAGGGMSFGGYSVFSALGGGAYQMKSGAVDTKANPVDVTAFSANVKKYLVDAKGKSNGFFPAVDTGCKDAFLAGKVPFAVIGNWEWKDYVAKGFSMATMMPVPGVKAGTYGAAFGSVSGALLTSFAATNGNEAGAKQLLKAFFASKDGQYLYQRYEQRPPANKLAAAMSSAAQVGFGKSASLASVPQIGAILGDSTGGKNYWDATPALWTAVLVQGKDVKTEATKLNTILKKNMLAGVKKL